MIEDAVEIPFPEKDQLLVLDQAGATPSPLIAFDDKPTVLKFIQAELSTERLERLYSMLFLVSNRRNISPLHHQLVKGRQVFVTERPDLHLVWSYDRIFIKPIPRCLLSHTFWQTHLLQPTLVRAHSAATGINLGATTSSTSRPAATAAAPPPSLALWREALGFLRTYASLVRHPSDLRLAQAQHLVPDDVAWDKWCHFIHGFAHLRDRQVAPRYHYGELRLTRLNFWCRLRLCGQTYFDTTHNYATYFGHFLGPYLFVFSTFTVVLGCLQVALQQDPNGSFATVATTFVPMAMYLAVIGLSSFPTLYLGFQLRELYNFIFWNRKLT